FQRVTGLEATDRNFFTEEPILSTPGNIQLSAFLNRRDRQLFAEAYNDPEGGINTGTHATVFPSTVAPIEFIGHEHTAREIANFQKALGEGERGFISAISPGSAARVSNEYYKTEEEHIWAWADALKNEYKAIVDAGLIVQIDDPSLAENWDQIEPEPSVEDYQRFTQIRIDVLTTPFAGSRKISCGCTCAGVRGMSPTSPTLI